MCHPGCAHEQARAGLSTLFLAPCPGRTAGDQPDRLRPPVSSGRLILWTAQDWFLGSESKCVIVGTWIFHPGFTRSVGPSDTQHRSRSPRRSRSPPFHGAPKLSQFFRRRDGEDRDLLQRSKRRGGKETYGSHCHAFGTALRAFSQCSTSIGDGSAKTCGFSA